MDIYTLAKEEADIKRQQRILDRKVYINKMRKREAKMLEALDELGIKYEKSRYYFENEEYQGSFSLRYDIHLQPEQIKCYRTGSMVYDTLTSEVKEECYKLQMWRGSSDSDDFSELDEFINTLVVKIKKANGC